MNIKKHLAACLAAAWGLLSLTGCSHSQSPQLANEITFSLDGISEITISYDEETIAFHESESGELIIREYMTGHDRSYFARTEQRGGSIKISEGGKPLFQDGFSRYVEVYLPASYHNDLTVTTTNGEIDSSEFELFLNTLRIDSTAGTVSLSTVEAQNIHLSTASGSFNAGHLNADTIRIDTTSGNFFCEALDGSVTYTTTSGNADIQSAIGSGNYKASNSGELNVVYTKVTGDLSFYNKNDGIHITLPADLEFQFAAAAKNGSVSTSFQECLSVKDGITSGTVGGHPTVTVTAETKNGTIEVTH